MPLNNIEFVEAFFNKNPLLEWAYDLNGNYLYANERFCKLFGVTSVTGKTTNELFAPDLADTFNRSLKEGYEMEKEMAYTQEVISAENEKLIFHITLFPLKMNNQIVVGATAYDITSYAELSSQAEFNSYVLDYVQQAVIGSDLQGKVFYWNKYATELYGWRREEMIGKQIDILVPMDINTIPSTEITKRLSQGESWSGTYFVTKKGGEIFPAFVIDPPILDKKTGKLVAIIGLSVDISEKVAADERLLRKNAMLKKLRLCNLMK